MILTFSGRMKDFSEIFFFFPTNLYLFEDLLEEGMATHSSILAWRIPMDRQAWQATVHGVTKSQTQLSD